MRLIIIALAIVLSGAASAQQPDPEFLKRAIAAVQAQRNVALDTAAVAEAKVNSLTDDLAKANARLKELEPKPAETPAKRPE
jgi:hypothetical protein